MIVASQEEKPCPFYNFGSTLLVETPRIEKTQDINRNRWKRPKESIGIMGYQATYPQAPGGSCRLDVPAIDPNAQRGGNHAEPSRGMQWSGRDSPGRLQTSEAAWVVSVKNWKHTQMDSQICTNAIYTSNPIYQQESSHYIDNDVTGLYYLGKNHGVCEARMQQQSLEARPLHFPWWVIVSHHD